MLATQLLASGITHLTDARYFAAWEVDYLAFPVGAANPEAISWDYLNALREWVAGPAIVAELGAVDDLDAWIPLLREHRIDHALVLHPAPASAPEKLTAAGITTILEVNVQGYHDASNVAEAMDEGGNAGAMLLDFERGGITLDDLRAGHPFGLSELDGLLRKRPCLLRIDLGDADAKAFSETHPLAGYAVRGSAEEKVGYKSFDELDGLLEALEVL